MVRLVMAVWLVALVVLPAANVRSLDDSLPSMPFEAWLRGVVWPPAFWSAYVKPVDGSVQWVRRLGSIPEIIRPPVPNPLVDLVRGAFIERNPRVTRVRVLELRSFGMADGPYVLLAWGIRADMKFEGRFDDELFGVFVVDPDLSRIERTLEIFPTQRWADYRVSIEQVTRTQVTVTGVGSYGDQALRKVYDVGWLWRPRR